MPSITGGIVVVGSRILMPIDLATVRGGFAMPVVGTIYFIGTIDTVQAVATVGTLVSGNLTASISSGVVDRIGTIVSGNVTVTISSGAVDRVGHIGTVGIVDRVDSLSGGVLDIARHVGTIGTIVSGNLTATISSGVVDHLRHVGTVAVVGSITTSGTLPVSFKEGTVQVFIRDPIVYTTILASLSPSTSSGTFTSPSVDALFYPGGVGFSIAYIGDSNTVSTVLIENSIDNTRFITIATVPIRTLSQYDAVFPPTRRYMRFTAINYSALSATIDAVISLMPAGA